MRVTLFWSITKSESLAAFLEKAFHGVSKSTLRSWLRYGLIRVNARVVKRLDIELSPGNLVEKLDPSPENLDEIKIVYEDEHLLILDKPAGLLSVDTDKGGKRNLFSLIKRKYKQKKVSVVHRLDRETSGLIAFALSEACEKGLKAQLQAHTMQRRYLAVIGGKLTPKEGHWELWLQELKNLSVRVCDPGFGEETLTFYRTLQTKTLPPAKAIGPVKELSLIELELATGKKHQIRVSAAHAGCPLVGDDRYGGLAGPRLGLHAYAISLTHPITQESMEWISPSVELFDRWWSKLPSGLRPPKPRSEEEDDEEDDLGDE